VGESKCWIWGSCVKFQAPNLKLKSVTTQCPKKAFEISPTKRSNPFKSLHRLEVGWSVFNAFGEGVCHPPSNLSSSWVCAQISCQPKHFGTGFVAPPKFFMIFIRFCITHHHLPFLVGNKREREKRQFHLHLVSPFTYFYLFLFSCQPPTKERRKDEEFLVYLPKKF